MKKEFAVVFSMLGVLPLSNAKEVKRPNILFCIADDAGLHMGAYGTTWVNTPAFDYVAEHGVLFTNMYTCNAKSAPSRATILTGRNSWQLEEACNHNPRFPRKFRSYPEALALNGYEVACTGKGWSPGIAKAADGTLRELTGKQWNAKKTVPPTKGITTNDYAGNFEEFMKSRDRSKPFCFWYGALEPHRGYEYESSIRYGKKISDVDVVPPYWPDNEVVRRDILDYSVEVEYFDLHIEKMLKILEESGEMENTIVVVTSDHNIPFPRCKGQEYYDSNHIPMAVMWKGKIKNPGRVIHEYISTIDLAPTFLEIAGVSFEESGMQPVTGKSFVSLLMNKKDNVDRDFVLIGKERHDVGRPYDQGYPIRGLIRGDYIYLRNFEVDRWPAGNPSTGYTNVDGSPTKTEVLNCRKNPETYYLWELSFGKRKSEELYNIREDPYCMKNLAGDTAYIELQRKMEKELFSRLIEQDDPRVFGRGEIFDHYPYMDGNHNFWERIRKGEKMRAGWTKITDIELDLGE